MKSIMRSKHGDFKRGKGVIYNDSFSITAWKTPAPGDHAGYTHVDDDGKYSDGIPNRIRKYFTITDERGNEFHYTFPSESAAVQFLDDLSTKEEIEAGNT